jgi:PAS domain S-box-containing protein
MDRHEQFAASMSDDGRYRLLVDAITDYAIYMLDADGLVTSWNPGAQRFKGYAPHEIIGEHFSRFYTEEDRARGAPELALQTAVSEGRFESEGWRVRKDGSRFWAHVVIDPVRTGAGEIVGFAKITRDLTERKASEDALRESERQFELLVQGVADYAIYMLDPTGRVTNWNVGAQRIKGYLPGEIIGEHFSRFYTEEDRARGAPELALQTAASEGRFEKEAWRIRKDGTRFWAHVIIDPIRNDGGELIGFAKITRDVTERREAQLALEQAREALYQSQKLDAIGQLTGGIAHDFNNLLMVVLASLELVRKRLPHDPKISPLIENAVQGAERGAVLTQRMLAFARKQELAMEAVELPALVRGMTGMLQRSLGPSVQIETRFPLGLPALYTDPAQLESVLLNLTVNARDAMPDGGTISIEARSETIAQCVEGGLAPGSYIRLSVADTGQGMDEATLKRAAEPFFTTKGVGKGTGLGLSMVHGLAEQSGGRLDIRSRLGEGTVVDIWLPQAKVDNEAHVSGTAEAETFGSGIPLVVLAVDDDALVLINTVAMLEDLGHRVFPATSAKDALATLRRESVDLVITDYAMPQMTGLQLAEAIKVDRPALPIILATGYAELPIDATPVLPKLSKPFFQRDLATAIRQVVDEGLAAAQ